MKQRLFRRRIKAADNSLLTGARANGGRETGIGQFQETLLRLLDRNAITGVEPMPSVTRAIHHNLNCHADLRLLCGHGPSLGKDCCGPQMEKADAPITFVQERSSKLQAVHLGPLVGIAFAPTVHGSLFRPDRNTDGPDPNFDQGSSAARVSQEVAELCDNQKCSEMAGHYFRRAE
jgi:hypothetical protein